MYTLEQKQEAIDVYLQVNSMGKTIQLLGYPGVRLLTSLALRGHGNEPFASFLYRSRNPSPSHTRPLILRTLARLSIPYLRSVLPHTMYISEKPTASFSIYKDLHDGADHCGSSTAIDFYVYAAVVYPYS